MKEKARQRKKRYLSKHRKAVKLTNHLTKHLSNLHQVKLKTNVEAEKRRKFFLSWVENLRHAFDLHVETSKMFDKYDEKGKIVRPANSEVNLAVLNVINFYLDSLTTKSLSHHYPDGTALLRDLIHICNADTEEVGDELKREFDTMKMGQTEPGSHYIIRVKAKANEPRHYHKKIRTKRCKRRLCAGLVEQTKLMGVLS
ncbi:MAG: hypothetical protein ACREOZ_03220 [Gloeomargaritales cyanobacterium]